MGGAFMKAELSQFQKNKLLHEFHTFFDDTRELKDFTLTTIATIYHEVYKTEDLNKDGSLEWKDFELARQKICEMSGWKPGTPKYLKTKDLFVEIWRRLSDEADENNDGKVSAEEWIRMWEVFNNEGGRKRKEGDGEDVHLDIPDWLEKYIEYKFNLYDRTGDGLVDVDEFEYVLGDFGVSCKDARACFLIFSMNNEKKICLDYFKELSAEYYRADDPGALGNFITGRLDFT